MANWKPLSKAEYRMAWDFVYDTLLFKPGKRDSELITLPVPHKCYDISSYYNNGYDESLYKNLLDSTINVFKNIAVSERMYALDWQHDCYSFQPELPFEKDEFDEWLISIFPNGDYLFFLTADYKNGIFADGIHFSISLFGEKIITGFEIEKPEIFSDSANRP